MRIFVTENEKRQLGKGFVTGYRGQGTLALNSAECLRLVFFVILCSLINSV